MDQAIDRYPHLMSFLKQPFDQSVDLGESRAALISVAS
ncbi:MAG: hypothetical protein LBC90_06600 [Candidatus Adiutrix sp.]|nr:hypothetical protein [Candidatus Adiutrix sp.]